MMKNEILISADEFCVHHHIEFSFIRNLQEFGMIEIVTEQETNYIPESQLEKLERILRLHQDLEINVEGIDAITHLLKRLNDMQIENALLKNKLRLYEDI
jgi:hypothetical protein